MTLFYSDGSISIYNADVMEGLAQLEAQSVQCVVTSPPYWGLRDYGVDGQIGLEETLEEYISKMVDVFSGVWRVLKNDGTLWLNLGDCYANHSQSGGGDPTIGTRNLGGKRQPKMKIPKQLKPKDLVGIPWRVAFALQQAGWILRSDIIWSKPNPMPESVQDRPTKAHEYIFLFSKSRKYYYDADAIRSKPSNPNATWKTPDGWDTSSGSGGHGSYHRQGREKGARRRGAKDQHSGFNEKWDAMSRDKQMANGANKRSVWTVATKPFKGAHFATFPPDLIRPCILAGSRVGDAVLDPFWGSGTTGEVAVNHSRRAVGIELNKEYCELSLERFEQKFINFCGD